MLQPLILGFGRAGRRHDKILQARGFNPAIVEPDVDKLDFAQKFPFAFNNTPASPPTISLDGVKSEISRRHFFNLESALSIGEWAFVVICTPPSLHLDQIERCLVVGAPVLCEKPLCGFGQLEQAQEIANHPGGQVMMAYNYRFNPDLMTPNTAYRLPNIEIYSSQHRGELPPWGILLDHVSHDLDILQWKYGDLEIETARVKEDGRKTLALVFGHLATDSKIHFKIHDEATKYLRERSAHLTNGDGDYQISPNSIMFESMYDYFLLEKDRGRFSLSDTVKVQGYLERANELSR